MSRRTLVAAVAAALTLSVVPAYAATQAAGVPGAVPAATPTRVAPSAGPTGPVPTPSAPTASAPGGPASPGVPAPTTAAPAPQPYVPPKDAADAVPATASRITPQNRFAVRADPTGRQPLDTTWPDAASLFTAAELAQVVPGVTAVRPRECSTSQVRGRASARSTRCTLDLTIKGEPPATRSRIMVVIRGFGLPAAVGDIWAAEYAEQRQRAGRRPGLYTFYRTGSLGTSGAYTDGTTTRVLLQRGPVAGEIWFSGIGFARLKPSYLASRQDYRQRVAPALAQLLAAKMPAAG